MLGYCAAHGPMLVIDAGIDFRLNQPIVSSGTFAASRGEEWRDPDVVVARQTAADAGDEEGQVRPVVGHLEETNHSPLDVGEGQGADLLVLGRQGVALVHLAFTPPLEGSIETPCGEGRAPGMGTSQVAAKTKIAPCGGGSKSSMITPQSLGNSLGMGLKSLVNQRGIFT
jgi:hypothetical protein